MEHVVLHRQTDGYRLDGTPFVLRRVTEGWEIHEDALDLGTWRPLEDRYRRAFPLLREARRALGEYARARGFTID